MANTPKEAHHHADDAQPAKQKTVVELLSDCSYALVPFVRTWLALPQDIRDVDPARNLADVLGIFTPEDAPPLNVGHLTALVEAFALITPHSEALLAGIDPLADEEDDGQKCRVCGCTNNRACMAGDVPCHWVEPDLCSACAPGIPVHVCNKCGRENTKPENLRCEKPGCPATNPAAAS